MARTPPPRGRPYAEPTSKTKPVKRCGAKTSKGKPCQNYAGKKTDHVGEGKCWLHGGRGGAKRDSPITHGLKIAALRPSTYPRAKEIRVVVDAAFDGQGDLWWARDLLRTQIRICYDRMCTLEVMRDGEDGDPSEAFLAALEEQFGRWFTRASTLTAQLPRLMLEIKKLGLEEKDKTYALFVTPPEGVDFVPFRAGDLPVDTRDNFLRAYAQKLIDSGDLDSDDDGRD